MRPILLVLLALCSPHAISASYDFAVSDVVSMIREQMDGVQATLDAVAVARTERGDEVGASVCSAVNCSAHTSRRSTGGAAPTPPSSIHVAPDTYTCRRARRA